MSENEEGIYEAYLYLVREFSVPRVDESEPLGQMGFEFVFDSQVMETIEPGEFWTQDAPNLDIFVDRVEAAVGFQLLLAARPHATAIFREEA